jgi:hypothetical protein
MMILMPSKLPNLSGNGMARWTLMKRWVTGEKAEMDQEDIDRELFELAREWMAVSKLWKLPDHVAKDLCKQVFCRGHLKSMPTSLNSLLEPSAHLDSCRRTMSYVRRTTSYNTDVAHDVVRHARTTSYPYDVVRA